MVGVFFSKLDGIVKYIFKKGVINFATVLSSDFQWLAKKKRGGGEDVLYLSKPCLHQINLYSITQGVMYLSKPCLHQINLYSITQCVMYLSKPCLHQINLHSITQGVMYLSKPC